ncbi:MAG: trigger factor [Holosporaceae bacterium]|jgi:trigger factor|nr:trigger factor [Holosporaceae bacterium]
MKILDESIAGLKRRYKILVTTDDIETVAAAKLAETAKKARLDGFRSGKAPLDVVKRMYGDGISVEAKQQALSDAVKSILKDQRVASSHKTEFVEENTDGIIINLDFEVIPSFELLDISGWEFEKYVVEIQDDEIDKTIEELRKEHQKWSESEKRVEEGQKVVVDLESCAFQKKIKGKEIKDFEIIIGSTSLVDNFWKNLIGAAPGDVREFQVHYPTDFIVKELAGKNTSYKATIKKIFDRAKYELNDEFAKALGFDDMGKVRERALIIVTEKYERISKDVLHRNLLEKMSTVYDFDVPFCMVEPENRVVCRQISEEAARLGKQFTPDIEEECLKLAKEHVRLGFVVAEEANRRKISVSNDEITRAINVVASMYPGQEKAIWDIYSQGGNLQVIIGPILEKKVVEALLSETKVIEKKCSVAELVAIDEEQFDFFKDAPGIVAAESNNQMALHDGQNSGDSIR